MVPVRKKRSWKEVAASCRTAFLLVVSLTFGCQPPTHSGPEIARTGEAGASSIESTSGGMSDQTENHSDKSGPVIVSFVSVPQLPKDIVLLESVFWEPEDTRSLRELIAKYPGIKDASVLEIGTGSGLVSLCCLQAGGRLVVATDINPKAVENARLNGRELGFGKKLDVRLVPRRAPGAWTVVRPDERFDFIISNPPWEDAKPRAVEGFALYDPNFELLDSLLAGARAHLNPEGRMWLAYGCVTAIRRIQEQAAKNKLDCRILDDRALGSLPEVFLPGMLIEITVPPESP